MANVPRQSVQDFMRDVRAQGVNANSTSPNVYGASLNADQFSVQITKNQKVLYPKVVWNGGSPNAASEGDNNQDTLSFFDQNAQAFVGTGSVTYFLSTLI
jgi:hypothetical protein